MERKITAIEFDWTGLEEWDFCGGYVVGHKGVESINEMINPDGKVYYAVEFNDGHLEQIYNISKVILDKLTPTP